MLGLATYARRKSQATAMQAAERAAEVFLRRKLFRRASDGRVINADFVALHYPLYWHYDFLGGLKAMKQVGRISDPRCIEAIDLLEPRSVNAYQAAACIHRKWRAFGRLPAPMSRGRY
jgi:hypothetical protein